MGEDKNKVEQEKERVAIDDILGLKASQYGVSGSRLVLG